MSNDAPTVPSRRWPELAAWLALFAVLLALVPIFIRMPLWVDVAFYDICGRHILRGGALERDFLFLPPPGMPWAMAAVRALLGPSPEAVRIADLVIIGTEIALLGLWLWRCGVSRPACVAAAAVLFAFYLTSGEICHCQPDPWMLLPALMALHLRLRQVNLLRTPGPSGHAVFGPAILEGMLWGAGCLVKPFVILPAAAVWLVSLFSLWNRTCDRKNLATDVAGILVGGLAMLALWQAWLVSQGTWEAYWQNYGEFGKHYYANGPGMTIRVWNCFTKMLPWGIVWLVAAPVAAITLLKSNRHKSDPARVLLAGCYIGWLFQASFIQMMNDYNLVPAILLGLTLIAAWLDQERDAGRLRVALGGTIILVEMAIVSVAFSSDRLAAWSSCWNVANDAQLKDRIRTPGAMQTSVELEQVSDFLRSQEVDDQDVLAYNVFTIHLLPSLDIRPASRFLQPHFMLLVFSAKREEMLQEMKLGKQRFIVTDAQALGLSPEQAREECPDAPLAFPPDTNPEAVSQWPYSEPVVFRSGRYYVHRVYRSGGDAARE